MKRIMLITFDNLDEINSILEDNIITYSKQNEEVSGPISVKGTEEMIASRKESNGPICFFS